MPATNPRVAVLSEEFTLKRAAVDELDQLAADEKRDLTDDERTEYEANLTRMEAISADIEKINTRSAKFDAVATVTASTLSSAPAPAAPIYTAPRIAHATHGEQLAIMHRTAHGDQAAASELETLQRSLVHGVSSDGVSPTTIEGDLINFVDASRPLVNVSNRKPLPDNRAKTFERPRLTTHTSVAEQAAEGDVLSSTAMVITSDTVTKKTYGGTVALSEQQTDWTDPAMLGLIPTDLAERYAIVTDDVLATAIEASVTSNKTVVSLTAAVDAFLKAVTDAAAAVLASAKVLPDFIYAAPDGWSYLASLPGGDGRPAFPSAGAVTNAAGSNASGVSSFGSLNVLGLPVVVDSNLTANAWGVGVRRYVETYEQVKGLLSVEAPTTLETVIAYRGYFATQVYATAINGFKTS